MITTCIKKALGLWLLVLLPTLSYAEVPSGHYSNHLGQAGTDIWDLSGPYSRTDDDGSLTYAIVQDDKGKISGQGMEMFSYDDDYDVTLYSTISGPLKSRGNVTYAYVKLKGSGTATDGYQVWNVKAKVPVTLYIDKINGSLIATGKGKICAQGEGCFPLYVAGESDIPGDVDGSWDLTSEIQNVNGEKLIGTAEAILKNGRKVPFTLKGTYDANRDLMKLRLKGSGGKFTIQAQALAGQLVFQTIKGKILGQIVKYP
jgi:hypothetical protein